MSGTSQEIAREVKGAALAVRAAVENRAKLLIGKDQTKVDQLY
jgi:hypothetical protein